MRTIWKFTLEMADRQTIELPEGAEIIAVQVQGSGPICLWAIVDGGVPRGPVEIIIRGTGHPLDGSEGEHLGTVQERGGALVWHIFRAI